MSNFLENIVRRHSTSAVDGETAQTVEPRLKSRFETDPGIEPSFSAASENDQDRSGVAFKAAHDQFSPPTLRHNEPGEKPTPDYSPDIQEDRLASLISQTETESFETGLSPSELQTAHVSGSEDHSATVLLPGSDSRSERQDDTRQGPGIQTTLPDLNGWTDPPPRRQLSNIPPEPSAFNDAITGSLSATGKTPLALEQDHPGREQLKPDALDSHPLSRESIEPGGIQTPQWLAETSSRLQDRPETHAAQESAEPVINVSIGRIEIRTTAKAPPRQPAANKKPRSIMSLDDYLDKRNRRQV